jgi:hypothetical protein
MMEVAKDFEQLGGGAMWREIHCHLANNDQSFHVGTGCPATERWRSWKRDVFILSRGSG